jgi:hypothetical protein
MRAMALAVLAGMMAAPAQAQADDPAVVACEAAVRQGYADYKRISAALDGDGVVIVHLPVIGPRQVLHPIKTRCGFSLDPNTSRWSLVSDRAPGEEACMKLADQAAEQIRAGRLDLAKQNQRRLDACTTTLKAAELREARRAAGLANLIVLGAYPIATDATALKARR